MYMCIKFIKFIYIGHPKLMCRYWRQVKEVLCEMSGWDCMSRGTHSSVNLLCGNAGTIFYISKNSDV